MEGHNSAGKALAGMARREKEMVNKSVHTCICSCFQSFMDSTFSGNLLGASYTDTWTPFQFTGAGRDAHFTKCCASFTVAMMEVYRVEAERTECSVLLGNGNGNGNQERL